jgi:hypothetical protein
MARQGQVGRNTRPPERQGQDSTSENPRSNGPYGPPKFLEVSPAGTGPIELSHPGGRLQERKFLVEIDERSDSIFPAEIRFKISLDLNDPVGTRPVLVSINEGIKGDIQAILVESIINELKDISNKLGDPHKRSGQHEGNKGKARNDGNGGNERNGVAPEMKPETLFDLLRSVPKATALEASQKIVGEPFFRYDSMCTYYPIVVFHFKEAGVDSYQNRTPFKVRWVELGPEDTFTMERRTELESRLNVFQQGPWTSASGPIRANL